MISTPTDRISIIEAMRGLASISVALFHFSGELASDIPKLLHSVGSLGVDVFFVISGFVIPLSLYGRNYKLPDFPIFLLRRLVRLEPPYLASIVLVVVMWHLSAMSPAFRGSEPDYTYAQLAFHFFYAIPLTSHSWLSPVYWSLTYEFVFYIIVGLTFPFLGNRNVMLTMVAICCVASFQFYFMARLYPYIFEFGAGIFLMFVVTRDNQRPMIITLACACIAATFWTAGMKVGVVVLLAAVSILLLRDIRCDKWAFFIGGFSYSLYLTHVVVGGRLIHLGMRFGEGPLYELLLIAVALFASIVFALVFAHFIEGPSTRASRRLRLFRTDLAATRAWSPESKT